MSASNGELHPIRILQPVAEGDHVVWVSGISPGSNVTISEGSNRIGERGAHSSVLPIPVRAINGSIQATAERGRRSVSSTRIRPVRDPGDFGGFEPSESETVQYGTFQVPTHPTSHGIDGGFEVPLQGELYMPDGNPRRHLPLVVIAHGHWPDPFFDEDSFRGYHWLGKHLASWGIAVCSVALTEVNRATDDTVRPQQWARAEVIMSMIDCLFDDVSVGPRLARTRIGLVGHSMGGEGVVLAQQLNLERRSPYGIQAIVNFAPTNYRREISSESASYFQIHGSMDRLLSSRTWVTDNNPRFNGFALYDRAWRRRSFAWIDGFSHDAYNTVWWPDSYESFQEDVIPQERQHAIARAFLTAFFADELLGSSVYRGYLSGPAMPQAVGDVMVQRQFQESTVEIVDDSGDAHPQYLLDEQQPRQKEVNRRNMPVTADGFGLQFWNLVDHETLPGSPHVTHGHDIAWNSSDFTLTTGLDALSVEPDGWLSLRASVHYDEVGIEVNEEFVSAGAEIDLTVEIDDGNQRAAVNLSSINPIQYPLPGRTVFSVFQSLRLPIDAFTAVNPALNIHQLQWLRLRPNGVANRSGWILIDDIEFETVAYTPLSRISMLRAHRLGGGYGPPNDFIDAEIIAQLNERPGETFGLQLRNDQTYPAASTMFHHLRSALTNRSQIRLGYQWTGPTVREIVRVIRM
jgi:dienelactone hydrolase